ncbi:MAG: hypothetical protein JXR70_13325 [Spirochaetales bacterium]|nr:hypothetical protein [Spirochaetales bacterium]
MRKLSLFLLLLFVFFGCEALNNPEELLSDDTGTVGVLSFDKDYYVSNSDPSLIIKLSDADLEASVDFVNVTLESSKPGVDPVTIQLNRVSPGIYEYSSSFGTRPWTVLELLKYSTAITVTASYIDQLPSGKITTSAVITLVNMQA